MTDFKANIARNISELRRASGITQSELAAKLNYSDKAISKWERGDSVPDVSVLKAVADTFGVTVDYLLADNRGAAPMGGPAAHHLKVNRVIIALLSACSVLLIATIVFVILELIPNATGISVWSVYLYSIPAVLVVLLIFNAMWGRRIWNFVLLSLLTWSVLLCLYVIFLSLNIWIIFVIGLPLQVIIFLWAGLRPIGGKDADK